MIWDQVTGHSAQIEMIRQAIRRERLAHAFLLVGPRGIGKKLFATTVAQCLFCESIPDHELEACGDCPSCRQMQEGIHPDLIQIGLLEGKKIISVNQTRGERDDADRKGSFCYEISHSPMIATRRIGIIDDADSMNEEAANSLLKTLEEPPAGAILILIADDTDHVLPTIRSRCQPVQFAPLQTIQVQEILISQGVDPQALESVLPLAEGSVGTARKLLEPELFALWQIIEREMKSSGRDSLASIKAVQKGIEAFGTSPPEQREGMQWGLRFTMEYLRQRLAQTTDLQQLDRLGDMLERCFLAEVYLNRSMPVSLCLEALFLELGRQSRS